MVFPIAQPMGETISIYAIKNNCNTMVDAEVGHRTISVAHVGKIAIQRGKKLIWNPHSEQFTGDEPANKLLHIPYRKPWDRIINQ